MRFASLAAAVIALNALVSGQEIPSADTTVPPKILRQVKAAYTPEAKSAGIEGIVMVEVMVLTDGSVGDDLKVVQSLDTEFGLDDQAVKASKQWKFQPATKDGKPVTARVVIQHAFTLR